MYIYINILVSYLMILYFSIYYKILKIVKEKIIHFNIYFKKFFVYKKVHDIKLNLKAIPGNAQLTFITNFQKIIWYSFVIVCILCSINPCS